MEPQIGAYCIILNVSEHKTRITTPITSILKSQNNILHNIFSYLIRRRHTSILTNHINVIYMYCRTSQTNHFCNSLNAEKSIAETQY